MSGSWITRCAASVIVTLFASHLFATTINETVGAGTLSYTASVSSGTCYGKTTYPPQQLTWTRTDYYGFSYADNASGIDYSLGGSASYVQLSGTPTSSTNCPLSGASPAQLTMGAFGFNIGFTVCAYQTCGASRTNVPSGYVDPDYVLASIVYAPPGPSSCVTYGATAYTGSSATIKSSMAQSVSVGTTVGWGGSIFSWLNGLVAFKVNDSVTTTQQASSTYGSSNTITTGVTINGSQTFPGTPIPWTGWWTTVNPTPGPGAGPYYNMHDYDQAYLWLNPVLPFEAASSSNVTWFGYGYDYCDEGPYIDVFAIQIGYLDPTSGWGPPVGGNATPLERGWATNSQQPGCDDPQVFPSGDGPALTSTDYAAILDQDPVFNQSYQLNLSGITSGDGRYTSTAGLIENNVLTTATDFPFPQEGGGASPYKADFSATYTNSTAIGKTTSTTNTQGYGIVSSLSGSIFGTSFQSSLSNSTKLTFTYSTQNVFTTTTSRYAQIHIQGPPCNWTGSACSPVYDGPAEFDVYQDNIFGSFMFWPVS
jgi:hypothetical protein